METRLAGVLTERAPDSDPLEVRLLAMLTVGALRIGTETGRSAGSFEPSQLKTFSRAFLDRFWAGVARLALDREG